MLNDYDKFLEKKRQFTPDVGFEAKDLNPYLYDFQRDLVKWTCRRGRAALFCDCGLGKTLMQLEWAKQLIDTENGNVLIVAPLAVSLQTQREGEKFGIPVNICRSQDDVISGINITNYEMLHKFDLSKFIGIVLDESSILKSYTGKFRNQIIDSSKCVPYRLACTATPAPNDFTELGNHSAFLGVLRREEMLAQFFINDTAHVGTWRLKGHAQKAFWEWLCSWAVMIKKPSDIGYDDGQFILPELKIDHIKIEFGEPLPGYLFKQEAKTLSERREARKASIPERVSEAAKLANDSSEPWIIWCNLNAESEQVIKMIPDAIEIAGRHDREYKEQNMIAFSRGEIRVLVTKPKIAGFGMNWQHCSNVIFLGLSDSYESFYQAVRRSWRYGQSRPVNVHVITADIEGSVVKNIERKERDSDKLHKEMVANMADITKDELSGKTIERTEYKKDIAEGNGWKLHLGDCVEIIKEIPDDSIYYSLFSPPFASLYTYTDSNRDMGNASNHRQFIEHFDFLVPELLRIIMPGRLVSIHCMNILTTLTKDGVIGLYDFRGDIIRAFVKHGWIYHSEVVIWKDPLVQATRTKALGLMHQQVCKDSTRCNQGLPDFLVTMRKPGENSEPVSRPHGFTEYIGERPEPIEEQTSNPRYNKYSHNIWQRYASPVWFDIRQTRTLNTVHAKENRDERHICPLQLDVIERCLELWTNKGDMVFTPFAGIGSVLYSAIAMERKGLGIELKESYFREAIKNLESVKIYQSQKKLAI